VKWAGHVACVGDMRNARKILIPKPHGKMSIGKTRSIWEDNIKVDLRKIVYTFVD